VNILVTAIGSFAADIVIKTLKQNQHYVIGCDVFPKEWIADAYNVDVFVQAPYARDKEEYISFIKNTCKQFSIQSIIPLIDPEVDILSAMKEELRSMGVAACVPDEEVTRRCRDKYLLPQFLREHDLCAAMPTRMLNSTNELKMQYPMLAKPRFGRSSEGVVRIHNDAEYGCVKEMARDLDYIIQPFMHGNVLTVDLVRNRDNTMVCLVRRELLRTPSGAGTTVEMIDLPELSETCRNIASALGVTGAVNLEFIEAGDQYYFLEINPRLSGGVTFSHISGYNVVLNHLRCFLDQAIDPQPLCKKMIIARKYEEYVTARM